MSTAQSSFFCRHLSYIKVIKPTLCSLAKAYFDKNKKKIWFAYLRRCLEIDFALSFLREDSVALIMSYANVKAGSKILVVESAHGLIAGGVLERLGGLYPTQLSIDGSCLV